MTATLRYLGTGDYSGEILATSLQMPDGTYMVSRWLPSSTTTPERIPAADLREVRRVMRADPRPGRLVSR